MKTNDIGKAHLARPVMGDQLRVSVPKSDPTVQCVLTFSPHDNNL